jgi:hypothetical protein
MAPGRCSQARQQLLAQGQAGAHVATVAQQHTVRPALIQPVFDRPGVQVHHRCGEVLGHHHTTPPGRSAGKASRRIAAHTSILDIGALVLLQVEHADIPTVSPRS